MFAGRGFTAPVPGAYDALMYKGALDCSASPNYPAADAGHLYKVSVAGKIGGASGTVVTAGDTIICSTDGSAAGTQAAVGANWDVLQTNIDLTNVAITGGSITGITDLAVADGGTGVSTLADGALLVGAVTGAVETVADVAVGQVLVSGGVGVNPAYSATPTVSSATLSTAIADNTATTQAATTAFAKSQDAVLAREPDQAVALTAADSGSSGITVADNDNLDMGTGNFAPYFNGLVPDFTPAADLILMQKWATNVGFELGIKATTGYIYLKLNTTTYTSSAAPVAVDGTKHKIVPVVTVGAVNTTVDFYFDGVALGTQQTAANPGTVSNAAALYILGTSAVRTAGTVSESGILNLAPSASEVLDMYRNVIPESWKWGSQTERVTDGAFPSFDNWTEGGTWALDGNTAKVTGDASRSDLQQVILSAADVGGKFQLKFTTSASSVGSSQFRIYGGGILADSQYIDDSGAQISVNGQHTITFTCISSYYTLVFALNAGATGSLNIDDVSVRRIGATLALQPEGIQVDKWYDASSNQLHANYPTTGSTLTRIPDNFHSVIRAQGPAIITTATTPAVAGTVTATADPTVVFSSANDAFLAGYRADGRHILGTTLISNSLTRYIVSWNSSTSCEVDSSVTWAGTAITSVQLPIATFVNSAGGIIGYVRSDGIVLENSSPRLILETTGDRKYYVRATGAGGNLALGSRASSDTIDSDAIAINAGANILTGGLTAAGTSAAKVLAMGEGTAPTTSPANAVQMWSADQNGAGTNTLYMRNEAGQAAPLAHQAPLTNLLTNSQWMAMSGSGLTQGVAVGRTTDFNVSNIYTDADGSTFADWAGTALTITDAGANLLLTATATSAASAVLSPTTFVVGKLYKVSIVTANGTHSWDNATDYVEATANAGTSIAGAKVVLNAGTNSFIWEATETNNKIKIVVGAFTDTETLAITSIYVDEVTPGYVAADTLAPDTMTKTATLDVHQYWNAASANTDGYGTYNLKLAKGADSAEYLNFGTAINYRDAQGRPVTLGFYAYSVTSAVNVKGSIHDGVTEIALSSTYVPANTLTWVEVTGTVAAAATALTPRVLLDGSTGDVAYVSEPILVRGSSIGAGNYQPIPNEVIWLRSPVALTNFNGTAYSDTAVVTTINLEAESSGRIGKGIKGITARINVRDSDSAATETYVNLYGMDETTSLYRLNPIPVNDRWQMGNVTMSCYASGDIGYRTEASGSLTLDFSIMPLAIQTQ